MPLLSNERVNLKRTMSERARSNPGNPGNGGEPFGAKTFEGKVKNLLASRDFHPGVSPERRKKLARGRVAQTLRSRGELS